MRKKKVIKTAPFLQAEDYPVGKEDPKALVLVDFKNEQPTDNQTYIDHIYECLAEKVTPQELLILARRLDALGRLRNVPSS